MVPSSTTILPRLTGEGAARLQPDAMLAAWGEVGSTGWRGRVLTPVTTGPLVLWPVVPGNTACRHLPHLSGLRFSAAASGQARARLPLRVFARLRARFSRAVQPCLSSDSRGHGHRLFWVDGAGGSTPDPQA